MRKIVFMGLCWALVAAQPAAAEPKVDVYYSPTYTACLDKAVSTLETRDCIRAEHDQWDGWLNEVYRTLMPSRSPAERAELRVDERAWLKQRKAKCDHAGDDEAGGSLQLVEIDQCYLDETIRRTVYLRGLH